MVADTVAVGQNGAVGIRPYVVGPVGLPIQKDLAGPEVRLTLVECFPDERSGCGAQPECGVELSLPILQYPSHKSCRPHLNEGLAPLIDIILEVRNLQKILGV